MFSFYVFFCYSTETYPYKIPTNIFLPPSTAFLYLSFYIPFSLSSISVLYSIPSFLLSSFPYCLQHYSLLHFLFSLTSLTFHYPCIFIRHQHTHTITYKNIIKPNSAPSQLLRGSKSPLMLQVGPVKETDAPTTHNMHAANLVPSYMGSVIEASGVAFLVVCVWGEG